MLPLPSPLSCDATCQAIASPSRSGSVASNTRSAALAAFLISARVLAFSFIVTYFGVKPFSTSTPSSRFGRSRRCPTVALTVYPRPRYLPIVFALVGDSTMTSAPPFAGAASVTSESAVGGSAGFLRGALRLLGFTSSSLSGTDQPFVNQSLHLYHPALVCASRTTSTATCSASLPSVWTVVCARLSNGS